MCHAGEARVGGPESSVRPLDLVQSNAKTAVPGDTFVELPSQMHYQSALTSPTGSAFDLEVLQSMAKFPKES